MILNISLIFITIFIIALIIIVGEYIAYCKTFFCEFVKGVGFFLAIGIFLMVALEIGKDFKSVEERIIYKEYR